MCNHGQHHCGYPQLHSITLFMMMMMMMDALAVPHLFRDIRLYYHRLLGVYELQPQGRLQPTIRQSFHPFPSGAPSACQRPLLCSCARL
jgi:hypothetical protein